MQDEAVVRRKEIKGPNGSVLRVSERYGIYWSPNCIQSYTRDLTTRSDDVYLATFPKSGTHWLYNIMTMLKNGTTRYTKQYCFLGYTAYTKLDNLESPRILGTHFPFRLLPDEVQRNKDSRIIYLVRNPKDICVSMYHYTKNHSYYQGDWEDFFDMFCRRSDEMIGGSWFERLKDWEKVKKENPNILFVKYEDLKTDFRRQVLRLSSYLGVSYDEEFYDEMATICQFELMNKNVYIPPKLEGIPAGTPNPILRKGEIGDWKHYFTVAQNEEFDVLYAKKMKNSKETFRFE